MMMNIAANNNYNAALEQSEKSNVSTAGTPNVDNILMYPVNGIIQNKRDANENIYSVSDLHRQETVDSDSCDEESSPKKSKQFTFSDSDLPDSDEIEEFLESFPRPKVIDPPYIETESKHSDDENNWSHRRRKKKKLVTKVSIEKLPSRFIMRQRVPNIMLSDEVSKKNCARLLQSIYLEKEEDEMDDEIIHENIKRLKIIEGKIDVSIEKPVKKDPKSKPFALKNTKESTTKRIANVAKSIKNKTDGENINITCISSDVKKTDYVPINKSVLPVVERRRSIRYQKAKAKEEDTMKAPALKPVSIPKKSVHEQSTVNNILSSSSESLKNLKKLLVMVKNINVVTITSTQARSIMKAQKLKQKTQGNRNSAQQRAKRCKKQDTNRNILNVRTRRQSARTRSQLQACTRTSEGARTLKHL